MIIFKAMIYMKNFILFISNFHNYYSKENFQYFVNIKQLIEDVNSTINTPNPKNLKNNISNLGYYLCLLKYANITDNRNIDQLVGQILLNVSNNYLLNSNPSFIKNLHILFQEFYKLNFYDNYRLNSYLLKQLHLFDDYNIFQENILQYISKNREIISIYGCEDSKFLSYPLPFNNFLKLLQLNKNSTSYLINLYKDHIEDFSLNEINSLYFFLVSNYPQVSESLPQSVFYKISEIYNYEIILSHYFTLCLNHSYHFCKDLINQLFDIEYVFEEEDIKRIIVNF